MIKNGAVVPYYFTAKLLEIKGKKYIVGIGIDLTERKRTEETLRETEKRYRSIIEFLPIGMHLYQLEQDGRLVFTGSNPAADRILGIDNSIFIGRSIEEAFPALAATDTRTLP